MDRMPLKYILIVSAAAALLLSAPARTFAADGDETAAADKTVTEETTDKPADPPPEDSKYGATGEGLLDKWGKDEYMGDFKPVPNADGSLADADGVIKTGDPDKPTYSFRPADQVLSHMSAEDKAAFDAKFGDMDLSNAYVQYGADGKPIGVTLLQENGGMSLLSDADALARADGARQDAAAQGSDGSGGGASGVDKQTEDAGASGQDDFTEDYLDSFQTDAEETPVKTPEEVAADAQEKLDQAKDDANAFNVASQLADNLAKDVGIQNLPQDLVQDLLDKMNQGPDGMGKDWPNPFAFGNDPGGSDGIFSNTWDGQSPHDSMTGGASVVKLDGSHADTLQKQHEAWASANQGYVPRSYDSTVAAAPGHFERNSFDAETAFGQLKKIEGTVSGGPEDGTKHKGVQKFDGGHANRKALMVDDGQQIMSGSAELKVVGTRDPTAVEMRPGE